MQHCDESDSLKLEQVEVKSYVGGLVKSSERKATCAGDYAIVTASTTAPWPFSNSWYHASVSAVGQAREAGVED
jgi:hypothetical protein